MRAAQCTLSIFVSGNELIFNQASHRLQSDVKMPIRKVVKKQQPPDTGPSKTGEYSNTFGRPEAYKPIQAESPPVARSPIIGLPVSSTRDLNYFFNLAGSLYRDTAENQHRDSGASTGGDAPRSYGDDFQDSQMDFAAVMVLWLFRHTATHVLPITERFHLGPADRQPLYALTAQPSIRSAQEFNELSIKRRDPIKGVCYLNYHLQTPLTDPRFGIQSAHLTSNPRSTW